MKEEKVDVAIIGGGPAGLAAALSAKAAGARRVLILDRNEELGGILPQCIHNGFGLHRFKEDLTGPEYAQRFIEEVRGMKIQTKLETIVMEINSKREILATNNKEGIFRVKATSLILAMGCRERTREMLSIPGGRPAGIFTAGVAQQWVNLEGYLPGKEIVILGSGDIGLIMARRLTLEGAEVKAVVEIMPYPGGLIRNVVQCLQDFDIPLLLEHTVTFIHGRDRVEAVTIAKVDAKGEPIPGTERVVSCDTLLLSVGLIPENELSSQAGIKIDLSTGGPVVDERMQTSVEGIFTCGNVVQVYDLVDYVSQQGEIAGKSAALYALGELKTAKRTIKLKKGRNVRLLTPQRISGQEKVTLFIRVANPEQGVKLRVGEGIIERIKPLIRPNQMVVWKVPFGDFKLNDLKELEVSVIREK
jgi:thioredoxin reductase